MFNAVNHGHMEALSSVSTIADGIAVKKPGEITYEMVKTYVDDIALVTEDEIAAAILALIEKQKTGENLYLPCELLVAALHGLLGLVDAALHHLNVRHDQL